MGWNLLLPLIAQYGIPGAYSIWTTITKHPEPTEEAWNELLSLSQKTTLQYINDARAKLGLPPLTSYDPVTAPILTPPAA